MPKWIDPVQANVAMGAGQREYETIGLRRETIEYDFGGAIGVKVVPQYVACIQFDPDELVAIAANNGRVYLSVLGSTWAPCRLMVADETAPTRED